MAHPVPIHMGVTPGHQPLSDMKIKTLQKLSGRVENGTLKKLYLIMKAHKTH